MTTCDKMKKMNNAVLSLIVLGIMILPSIAIINSSTSALTSDSDYLSDQNIDAFDKIVKSDRSVVVFGDDTERLQISEDLKLCTSKISTGDIYSVENKSISVFTESWFKENNAKTATEIVGNFIDNGGIVTISNNNNILWDSLGTSNVVSSTATLTSIYKEGNTIHCFGVECASYKEALERTYAWADEVTKTETTLSSNVLATVTETEPGTEIESYYNRECTGYGWMYIRTLYYLIPESNSSYDYYSARYTTQMVPNSGSYNSGLDVKSVNSNGILMGYGPYSTSGTSTVGISLGYTSGTQGVSLTGTLSWSYSIPDVTVMDYTSFGTNTLDIRHDVSENRNVGTTSYTVEPGKIMKISTSTNNGDYSGTDTYKAQFCKHGILGYNSYNDFSTQLDVTI